MSAAPIYRDEIKGNVRETIAEFEATARNQIARSENFIFDVEDLPASEEYSVYLTHAEMDAAFKRAQRVA